MPAVAFFSSGHYKRLEDFDCSSPDNPHRLRFADVNFAHLKEAMVLDRQAIDTLANFTCFLRYWRRMLRGKKPLERVDVLVITSSYHATRARAVAAILLGSQGLSFRIIKASPDAGSSEAERSAAAERAARKLHSLHARRPSGLALGLHWL
eukprot:TRINITY_DN9696_c4_g1_i1.p1 TRINITY_DN9696_c4_g1~~TRINITY_DN9696_c4_g1_i1.p1  ORF type:complete len:151 (+),score=28.40 TRINITY_DN9696_c4_g1_i1:40-492(+)